MKPSELLSKVIGFADDMSKSGKRFEGSSLQKQKLSEAQDPDRYIGVGESLYDNIKRHGVQSPVVLMGDHALVLGNGHHRLAAAHQLEKEGHDIVVPVIYGGTDTFADIDYNHDNAEQFDQF
jgi:hypothetical protein